MDFKEKEFLTKRLTQKEASKLPTLTCCICGNPILGTDTEVDWPYEFSIAQVLDRKGRPKRLFCHGGSCKGYAIDTVKWVDLPEGPLKKLYRKAVETRKLHNVRKML